jgi:hypothetical protein
MSKERPYQFVPTTAMVILINEYLKLIQEDFKKQKDLDLMLEEMKQRFSLPQEDKQISIEEYMRSRSKGE